jgi:hypothetical protein
LSGSEESRIRREGSASKFVVDRGGLAVLLAGGQQNGFPPATRGWENGTGLPDLLIAAVERKDVGDLAEPVVLVQDSSGSRYQRE